MTALLRAELLKLRTTRTFAVLVAEALATTLLLVGLNAASQKVGHDHDLRRILAADAAGWLALLLAAVVTTGEWRHRTIAGTFLAAPDRTRVLAAKVCVCAGAGVALSFVGTVAAIGLGTAILSRRGLHTPDVGILADILWRNLVIAGLYGAIGVAVGALVRSQPATIAGLLIAALMVEPALLATVPEAGRFGPLVGAPSGIAAVHSAQVLLLVPALLVMLAWTAAALAGAALRLRRGDLV